MRKATIHINDQQVELTQADQIPFAIRYSLEDIEDFQRKKGAETFNLEIPATLMNAKTANSFHEPGVEDLTTGKLYRSAGSCCVEVNGYEVLVGKAFLTGAKHTRVPVSYTYDLFGDNADWVIDLKETTLFDLLQHINFVFSKEHIIASWLYDGSSESLPYVFAPVRYREAMADGDTNMKPDYMRPAISPYWIIFWAFKSIGYKINSEFFNTSYFRRQVMPWTWGNFLYSEGTRQENLAFLAKAPESFEQINADFSAYIPLNATNDSTDGAYNNNGSYSYDSIDYEMKWEYLPAFNFGNLNVTLSLILDVWGIATWNSEVKAYVRWFKNGSQIQEDIIMELEAPLIGRRENQTIRTFFCTANVDAGDVISAKVFLYQFDTSGGDSFYRNKVVEFKFDFFRIPIGGVIDFRSMSGLKQYKFLDLLRGIADDFNLAFSTNNIVREVTIEPLHPYSLNNDLSAVSGGYIRENYVDWSGKQDLSKESELQLYSDGEREMLFVMKDDNNDGGLKLIQDRYSLRLARGKYVLPSRFKSGKNEKENRFFAPVMHYVVDQWKEITGEAPQMIAMIPENISNTSRQEAQGTFLPKLAYYKGFNYDCGWTFDGDDLSYFPYMFAVNYKPGGENDPILSYSDEKIGNSVDGYEIGKGLLKRFYWQRLAIMRNGQYYRTPIRLRHIDATDNHRNFKIIRGNKYELVSLEYKPLEDSSSETFLRKWEPVTTEELNNTYPSEEMLMAGSNATNGDDVKYSPLILLASDIPQ